MLLQRLATGATGVKQARYRRGPTRGSGQRGTRTRMRSIYTVSLALAVQCETMHGVYEFRRGFCTLVLSFQVRAACGEVELILPYLCQVWTRLAHQ